MNWHTAVRYISGVGPVYAKRLENLNIFTLGDLLYHIPFRYEDYSKIVKIKYLKQNEPVTVMGKLTSVKNVFTKNHKNFQTARLADETGFIDLLWFNQQYITNTLKIGSEIAISGKAEIDNFSLKFNSPDYEVIYPGRMLRHTARLIPVYPLTAGISSKWFRNRIAAVLTAEIQSLDFFPIAILNKLKLPQLLSALSSVHFPKNAHDPAFGKKRLAFDELFALQIVSQIRRNAWKNTTQIQPFKIDPKKIETFKKMLPFKLTAAQERAASDIVNDFSKNSAMNRLLQGDVGSGKTIIAAIGALTASHNGKRSMIMAPTEILAKQHFATLSKLFDSLDITVSLITSSDKQLSKNSTKKMKEVDAHIIVGTHALLEDKYEISDVGFVVIDEQHRFGVKQRARLRQKGETAHTLTMTATPIPRTIMLTVHGDLDISVLDEMPVGRLPIKTRVVAPEKRATAYIWIQQKILSATPHQQAFIVCPFIEPSETLTTVKAVTQEFAHLQKNIFPKLKLALLHGKMKSADKDQVLSDFRNGTYDILVATPVVEVGIDIPNATIMVIEAADRFGLAQLHQLRGRVGRGDVQSFCLLFNSSSAPVHNQRLQSMETTHNGIALAELDLKIRGPGTIYSTEQHGKPAFRIASYEDFHLLNQVTPLVTEILTADPSLSNHPHLKERVVSGTIEEVTPD